MPSDQKRRANFPRSEIYRPGDACRPIRDSLHHVSASRDGSFTSYPIPSPRAARSALFATCRISTNHRHTRDGTPEEEMGKREMRRHDTTRALTAPSTARLPPSLPHSPVGVGAGVRNKPTCPDLTRPDLHIGYSAAICRALRRTHSIHEMRRVVSKLG